MKRRSIIMPATGPDFISLQGRDLDASQAFYEQYLGLVRSQAGTPHALVFGGEVESRGGRAGTSRRTSPFSSPDAVQTECSRGRAEVASAEVYWLSTARPDGRPHVT